MKPSIVYVVQPIAHKFSVISLVALSQKWNTSLKTDQCWLKPSENWQIGHINGSTIFLASLEIFGIILGALYSCVQGYTGSQNDGPQNQKWIWVSFDLAQLMGSRKKVYKNWQNGDYYCLNSKVSRGQIMKILKFFGELF